MQPNPTDIVRTHVQTARAARARLIAAHGPLTLLELCDLADAPITAVRRTVDELERLGLIKQHGRMVEWRTHSPAQTAAAIDKLAAGTFKPRSAA
jgi:predicted transcriptional regulator